MGVIMFGIQSGRLYNGDRRVWELISQGNEAIVIHGAGFVGAKVLSACRERGVEVLAFSDNNPEKATFHGVPVVLPDEAANHYRDSRFLVAVADMAGVARQLRELGITKISGLPLLTHVPAKPAGFSGELNSWLTFRNCLSAQFGFIYPEKCFIGFGVEMYITERCTLHCRDCATLTPRYRDPVHRKTADILREIDTLHSCLGEVARIRLLGGEPLLHPDIHVLTAHITDKIEVGSVGIITNGTVMPRADQWAAFANEKVFFRITDYGDLSTKRQLLVEELVRRGIGGFVLRYDAWSRWKVIAPRIDTAANKLLFESCRARHCLTLVDNRLYRCEHAANGVRLGLIPDSPNVAVDLYPLMTGKAEPETVRRAIWDFVYALDAYSPCAYCLGNTLKGEKVPPAIQDRQ